jgi:hypothetical protein
MKPDRAGGEPGLLNRVLEEMGRRSMENAPYQPAPVVRWNAKIIPLPTPQWPLERQRAVAAQNLKLAWQARRALRRGR